MKTRKRRAQDAGREEQQGTSGTQRLEAEFVQYRAMRQEIAALRRQRAALYVTDTVRASGSEHPYLAHTVAIAGKDQRLTRRIDARIERLRRRCEAVENTIVAEEDSRDRLVLSLRYLEGSSWREIGQRMGTGIQLLNKLIQTSGGRAALQRLLPIRPDDRPQGLAKALPAGQQPVVDIFIGFGDWEV